MLTFTFTLFVLYRRWKDPETECLKRLVREHLRADPNADIKELGRLVEEQNISIPWTAISKKMGKRSRLSCFKKWQKLTGIIPPSESAPKDHAVKEKATSATQGFDFANATEEELDVLLLTEIINQGKDPPDWSQFSGFTNPQDRWEHLFNEWQISEDIQPEDLATLDLFRAARLVLEDKKLSGDAKLAAATVEAVDLPSVSVSDTRAV